MFLAEDAELHRRVVLEFMSPSAAADPEAAARFRRQAQAIAALDHPNIVTIYEIGTHEGVPFVAMEYVGTQTLADVLASAEISELLALDLALQLGRGLSEASRAGITFCAIRPERVLMGPRGRIRIAVFDQVLDDASPRVAMETKSLADSARPDDSRTTVRLIGDLLKDLNVGGSFEKILERAICEDREDRYESVEELVSDVEATLQDRSDSIAPPARPRRAVWPLLGAAAVVLVVLVYTLGRRSPGPVSPTSQDQDRQVIAVLPFENLGDAEDEYFADGIIDELTSRLARIQGLAVISRTSARAYKNSEKTVREIGEELNADFVVEGAVRWNRSAGTGRVRITPRLVRVTDETYAWSSHYEREITEIFDVQSEIASRIVDALNVTLLSDERQALTEQPTDDIDAYQAYLRGMKLLRAPDFSRESFELGVQMFERAVELDPEFALAHARLSSMHSRMVHYGYDRSESRLERAKAAVDRALELRPDLVEGHLARGLYHYWGERDYERALASLDVARAAAPQVSEILLAMAYVKRRQGDLEAAIDLFERDIELSPLDANAAVGLGETYGMLRRFAEGERSFERAIALAPDNAYPYTELALLYLRWRGDAAMARELVERMPSIDSSEGCRVGFLVELLDRRFPAALEHLRACSFDTLEAAAFFIPISLYEGMTLQAMGETARARDAFERARAAIEPKLESNPEDPRLHAALGLTLAGLGRGSEAVRHGRRSVELYPTSKDFVLAQVFVADLAMIHTLAGEHDEALDRLDSVLTVPSIYSTAWIDADPRWDPLREHPGFARIVGEH